MNWSPGYFHHLGHADCVRFVKKFNIPMLILGGGGYTIRNVSRAWAYETGVIVGQEIGPGLKFWIYINFALCSKY